MKWRDGWAVDKIEQGSYVYRDRHGRSFMIDQVVSCRPTGFCACNRCSWKLTGPNGTEWFEKKGAARLAGIKSFA